MPRRAGKRSRGSRRPKRIPDIRLDERCRAIVRIRDSYQCRRCESKHAIQWSHIHTARIKMTRWMLQNSKILCASCHRWWHDHPTQAGDWIKTAMRQDDLDAVDAALQDKSAKVDRPGTLAYLEQTLEWLDKGGDPRKLPGARP